MLDRKGNLSHFDGSRWHIENLKNQLPAVPWTSVPVFDLPGMSLTADGSLWIVWHGVWRFDGQRWSEIRLEGRSLRAAVFIGEEPDRIWLRDGDAIEAVTPAGEIAARYTEAEMGRRGSRPPRLAARAGELWVSVGNGLLTRQGGRWQEVALPDGLSYLSEIALAPDLKLWAAGAEVRPRASVMANITGMLALCLGLMVLTGLWIWGFFGSMAKQQSRSREVVSRVAGPSVAEQQPRRRTLRQQLVLLAIMGGFFLLLDGPLAWSKWLRRLWSGFGPIAFILLIAVGFLLALAFPLLKMRAALHRGDYQRALWWTERLGSLGASVRGTILRMAGRPIEAEAASRRANDLGDLGCALMDQGRYEEAMQALDGAIELDSGEDGAHADKAELYLLQGIEPDKALACAERAIAIKQSTWLHRNLDRNCDAEFWADKAWALAQLGRREEARAAIETATQVMYPQFRPALAGVHWRIGMALVAMQEKQDAIQHFRTARELDPLGGYGAKATQAERTVS